MRSTGAISALALLLAATGASAQDKSVFAHFIVGNVQSFTQDDWASNIALAQASGIDGFALNIGGENIDTTTYTQPQLDNAYNAADAAPNFKLFISFDYGANPSFDVPTVSGLINTYKGRASQYNVGISPMASTFEGPDQASNWGTIKSNTGAYFCPDYTSKKGQADYFTNADCALSWDVWPVGATDPSDQTDIDWQSFLSANGNKAYMMGISPWFYTNLPTINPPKQWTWRGNKLWHERWQSAAQHQPQLVEIITWNDFGESHYIGPIVAAEEYPGSEDYVTNMPHDAWRILLKPYIDGYKGVNGSETYTEDLVYAHKINPGADANGCTAGAVVGNQPGQPAATAADVSTDAVDVYVILNSPAEVSVTIGSGQPQTFSANVAGVNYFSAPFNGDSGAVTYSVTRDGSPVMEFTGATISTVCTPNGQINYNAVTGSYSTK